MSELALLPENAARIEATLQRLGWLPPRATITPVGPAGEGNMNRTLRVRSSAGPASLVLKQAVPYVAKYPDIAAPLERCASEAAFYEAIACVPAVAQGMPECIGYCATHHLLAFEDLGTASDLSRWYAGDAEPAEVRAQAAELLAWLGALHAIQPPPTLTNMAMRGLNHEHIFDLPLRADNGLDSGELSAIAAASAANTELVERAAALGEVYLGTRAHASPPALLHGDFYPGSWLATPQGLRIIDPEFGFVGPAEFDIGVLLAHLQFAGLDYADAVATLDHYAAPARFSQPLAGAFAGIELLRRLLGVAQLPLAASTEQRRAWVATGTQLVMQWQP